MDRLGYDIIPWRPEFRSHVVSLMQYLWGKDPESNWAYFKWKYEDNPYTESPLGIAALYKGEVVGFRGYFAIAFEAGENSHNLIVLFPGDTCVHPEHRQKGLSVLMGSLAVKEYAPTYRLFFNTTSTRNSLPGYRRLGFVPLAPKVYLTLCPLPGLARYIPTAKKRLPLSASRIRFGKYEDILVSGQPRPKAMASLAAAYKLETGMIRLFQDEVFFRWRFCSPLNKYVFYYLMEADNITAYVVMGVSPNNQRGYILDWAEREDRAIGKILRYVIRAKHFDLLSIFDFCLGDILMQTFKDLGFKTHSLGPDHREKTSRGIAPADSTGERDL